MNNEAVSRFNKRLLCRRQFFSLQKDKKLSFPRPVNVIDLRNTTTSSPASRQSPPPPPAPPALALKRHYAPFQFLIVFRQVQMTDAEFRFYLHYDGN